MYRNCLLSIIAVTLAVIVWNYEIHMKPRYGSEPVSEVAPEEEKPTVTVLCYGDSNTWGNNPADDGGRYPKSVRWPGVLGTMLGDRYDVVSEGLNGRQTGVWFDDIYIEDGLAALPAALATDYPVDVLIFMLGTNDCKTRTDIPVSDIGAGMEELIHTSRETLRDLQGYEPEIIVVSPPSILECVSDSWLAKHFDKKSIQKCQELKTIYQKICEKEHCIFVNGTDTIDVSEEDGVHLTPEGHQQLAELLYKTIQDLETDKTEGSADTNS